MARWELWMPLYFRCKFAFSKFPLFLDVSTDFFRNSCIFIAIIFQKIENKMVMFHTIECSSSKTDIPWKEDNANEENTHGFTFGKTVHLKNKSIGVWVSTKGIWSGPIKYAYRFTPIQRFQRGHPHNKNKPLVWSWWWIETLQTSITIVIMDGIAKTFGGVLILIILWVFFGHPPLSSSRFHGALLLMIRSPFMVIAVVNGRLTDESVSHRNWVWGIHWWPVHQSLLFTTT